MGVCAGEREKERGGGRKGGREGEREREREFVHVKEKVEGGKRCGSINVHKKRQYQC